VSCASKGGWIALLRRAAAGLYEGSGEYITLPGKIGLVKYIAEAQGVARMPHCSRVSPLSAGIPALLMQVVTVSAVAVPGEPLLVHAGDRVLLFDTGASWQPQSPER
jgi:hypothetical protein